MNTRSNEPAILNVAEAYVFVPTPAWARSHGGVARSFMLMRRDLSRHVMKVGSGSCDIAY